MQQPTTMRPSSPLQPVAGKFFIFTGFMVLCQLAATSMALAISAVCREVDLSGQLLLG